MLELMYWAYAILFALVLLQLLYDVSTTFRYYVKVTALGVGALILSVYVSILSLSSPGNVENYKYAADCVVILRRMVGVEVVIENIHHVPDTPCVLVANHQTVFDLFGMMAVRPARCALVAKQGVRYMLSFGVCAAMIGTVFVHKRNTGKAIAAMDRALVAVRDQKISLFFYPEGVRNGNGGMLPFKKGAFHLAVKAQVPIVPLVFTGYDKFYSAREKRFDNGTLTVTCLPPVSTRGLGEKDVTQLAEKVRQQMIAQFSKRT